VPREAVLAVGTGLFFFYSTCYQCLGCGQGVTIGSHFAIGKVTLIEGRDRQVFGVNLGVVHGVSLGQIWAVQPVEGHGGNLVEF